MKADPIQRAVQRTDIELVPGALYQAPSGRICRLAPPIGTQQPQHAFATLIYDRRDGGSAGPFSDGFTLSRFNWYLLRRVA